VGDRKKGYPLEAAARLRRLQRDERAREVREASGAVEEKLLELEEAGARVRAREVEVGRARDRRWAATHKGTVAGVIQAMLAHEASLTDELASLVARRETLRKALDAAQARLDQARRLLAEAQAEMRSLDRHREKWAEERRREAERKAEDDP